MAARLKIIAFTLSNATLMLFILCLGSQNLRDRHSLNLLISSTPPLPTGFLIGTSISIGIVSAGCTRALLIEDNKF